MFLVQLIVFLCRFALDVAVVVYMMYFLRDAATSLGAAEPSYSVENFTGILYDEYCTRMGIPAGERDAFALTVARFVRLRKLWSATIALRILSQPAEEVPAEFGPFCRIIVDWFNGKGRAVCAGVFEGESE